MGNQNWVSFPGLPNLTQDGDGRPQLLDLVPGKQRGTPLNTLLFNPLIRALCDLRDALDNQTSRGVLSQADDNDLRITYVGVRKDGVIWAGTEDGQFFHAQPAGDYALRADVQAGLANAVQTMPDDADYQLNHIGVNKASGDIWGWNGAGNVFFHMASVAALQAETVRAQTAEAGLQPAGNYVASSATDGINNAVTVIGVNKTGVPWLNSPASGGTVWLARQTDVTAALANAVQTMPDDADYQLNHIGVNKASGDIWGWNGAGNVFFHMAPVAALQAEAVRAQTAEAGLQPAGNYVVAAGTRRKKTLGFTVNAAWGQRIDFSEAFADDDVQVFLTPQDTGGNRIHVANWFNVDRSGFSISLNAWTGSGFVQEGTAIPVMVRAEGWV